MLSFEPVADPYSDAVFHIVKDGLYEPVNQVFGWDDAFQRERLRTEYQADWFHWVRIDGADQALLCYKHYDRGVHVHLLIVLPAFRQRGVGRRIMERLMDEARERRSEVTLSSFTCNEGAVRFYRRLGFQVETDEGDFLVFRYPALEAG